LILAVPTFIFAGGGTGGHLYPALAVAQILRQSRPEARIIFACSDRDIDRRILAASGYEMIPQPVRPMPRSLRGWGAFAKGLLAGRKLARELLERNRPAAVFGLGGFAAFPVVRAARAGGIPQCLLSIDAVAGLANRSLAKYVDVIFTQFERTAADYGRHAGKARQVGCPVRPSLLSGDIDEARRLWGLHSGRKTLVIVPGSLGAATINDAVVRLKGELDGLGGQWQLLHVTGPGKLQDLRQAYSAAGIGATVLEFCERMDLAYAVADLVLCRAGASTIGELYAVGKPAVLMPYPFHRDQHQRHNAQEMVSAGAAELVTDLKDAGGNAQALRTSLLAIMADQARLDRMRQAAEGLARPDAATKIADWLLSRA
jgi:UDP-N-acetylglucosamine--N-acetylmuramyl-(pentapeptide) pyrophosphoryl-undecaprenol N-acetylglucosamine transferase